MNNHIILFSDSNFCAYQAWDIDCRKHSVFMLSATVQLAHQILIKVFLFVEMYCEMLSTGETWVHF